MAKIERPELLNEGDLGLTLDIGKHILRQAQAAIVAVWFDLHRERTTVPLLRTGSLHQG